MMGLYAIVPFCALGYFIMTTKQRDNKESETKKTSKFPILASPQRWYGAPPKHQLTAPHQSSPTLGTLPCTMVRPWVFWQTVGRDGGLEPSCPRMRFLHLIFLLLLSLASQSFLLPLLCILTFLPSSFLRPPLRDGLAMVRLSWSCYN